MNVGTQSSQRFQSKTVPVYNHNVKQGMGYCVCVCVWAGVCGPRQQDVAYHYTRLKSVSGVHRMSPAQLSKRAGLATLGKRVCVACLREIRGEKESATDKYRDMD